MNKENDFFRQHPREGIQLLLLGGCFIWQSAIVVVGLLCYALLGMALKVRWWVPLSVGLGSLFLNEMIGFLLPHSSIHFLSWLKYSFAINVAFWKINLLSGMEDGIHYLLRVEFIYLVGISLVLSSILTLIDLYFIHPHQQALVSLKNRQRVHTEKNNQAIIEKKLATLDDDRVEGTALGVAIQTGQPVIISDKHLNQIALVLGTTGGGKTITLRRFFHRAISQGYPLIIIDGKPTAENVAWVRTLADQYQRKFYGFNCDNAAHYDPLAKGGFTELKDKIITLKDEWSSDYYRSIAEDYLQTTFEVLIKRGQPFDLKEVAQCLTYDHLCVLVQETKNDVLKERVLSLKQYEKKEITGLQAHLHILLHSELGDYFNLDDTTFNLAEVIAQDGVVYFALPALRFPSFSKVLGKLVANDLKAVIDQQIEKGKKIFTVFDEYSVFAGEQSLNLANMGREKGLHVLFGTQGLADLEKVDKTFLQQIVNCANTMICHRLNDHVSAEMIAQWAGTKKDYAVTAQIDLTQTGNGLGSVREVREFMIHPDAIKQELKIGEAFYITKVDGFRFEKVKVKYT
jgi:conjugal transfer pilus assembly protein TraD